LKEIAAYPVLAGPPLVKFSRMQLAICLDGMQLRIAAGLVCLFVFGKLDIEKFTLAFPSARHSSLLAL